MSNEITKTVTFPKIREQIIAQGAEPFSNTPEEFAAMMKADTATFARIIKTANIKADEQLRQSRDKMLVDIHTQLVKGRMVWPHLNRCCRVVLTLSFPQLLRIDLQFAGMRTATPNSITP